ncbi:hypothetical protein IIC65_01390 [Candidatus Sumerlaeota bacterium]|nr:hypothetical protein [Candidatus Sumerlaeota bacterium]
MDKDPAEGGREHELATKASKIVSDRLKAYADRGIFRSYNAESSGNGKATFKFVWLNDAAMRLVFDEKQKSLTFKDLLPNIPARSSMDKELRAFVAARSSEALPEHRRSDAKRAEVKCVNRGGNVSIVLKVKKGEFAYGVQKAVNLINEIMLGFLVDGPYYEYMIENFDIGEE